MGAGLDFPDAFLRKTNHEEVVEELLQKVVNGEFTGTKPKKGGWSSMYPTMSDGHIIAMYTMTQVPIVTEYLANADPQSLAGCVLPSTALGVLRIHTAQAIEPLQLPVLSTSRKPFLPAASAASTASAASDLVVSHSSSDSDSLCLRVHCFESRRFGTAGEDDEEEWGEEEDLGEEEEGGEEEGEEYLEEDSDEALEEEDEEDEEDERDEEECSYSQDGGAEALMASRAHRTGPPPEQKQGRKYKVGTPLM